MSTFARVALVALVAGVVYANTLRNQLVNDDLSAIVMNSAAQRLEPRLIFTTPSWSAGGATGYRPLVTLTFALNFALGGVSWSYHLLNLLLHAVVSVLVYAVARRLSGREGPALAAAVLFAAHPLNTAAVASVVGRADVTAALFVLLALWIDSGTYAPAPKTAPWFGFALVVAAFGCGLLSKENAVVLIPLVFGTDLLVRCRGRWAEFLGGLRGPRGVLYGALLLVLVAYSLWRYAVTGAIAPQFDLTMNPLAGEATTVRLLNAAVIAGRCLGLLIMPLRLSADYTTGALPIVYSVWDWRLAVSLLAIACCIAFAVVSARRQMTATWGILFGAIAYGPVSNLAVPLPAMMAEQWMYLPCVGFCVALAFGAAALLAQVSAQPQRLATALTAALVAAYGARAVQRNRDWHDSFSLWTATLRVVPGSAQAQTSLGYALLQTGRAQEAVDRFEALLRESPGSATAYQVLGDAYALLGTLDKAVANYRQVLALNPEAVDVRRQLGLLYLRQGAVGAGVQELTTVSEARPQFARTWADLGKAHYMEQRVTRARSDFQQALRLEPKLAEAHVGLGACAQAEADFDGAAQEYLNALELGEPPTDNLRASIEAALTGLLPRGPVSAAAASRYAARALAFFPQSQLARRLAESPPSESP